MAALITRNGHKVLLDAADFALVGAYKWYAAAPDKRKPEAMYAIAKPYDASVGRQITLWMHRLIMSPSKGTQVDHINRNGLDNRRENLRLCTQSQNNANSSSQSNSGYRGVFRTRFGTFQASISTGNRTGARMRYLGTYRDAEDAARAYDAAARDAFGEFATLNFPIKGAA